MNQNFPEVLIAWFNSRWPKNTIGYSQERGIFSYYVANRYIEDISNVKIIMPQNAIKSYFNHRIKENSLERSWITLSVNTDIEWTNAFIKENINKLKWEDTIIIDNYQDDFDIPTDIKRYGGLCSNPSIKINRAFITDFFDQINWQSLGLNEGLDWSIELLKEFRDYWVWSYQDYERDGEDFIEFIGPDCNFIDPHEYRFDIENFFLSANHTLPWNEELLEEFKTWLDWSVLSKAYYIPWSISLLKKFFPFWDKERLIKNYSFWEKIFSIPVSQNKKIIEAVFT